MSRGWRRKRDERAPLTAVAPGTDQALQDLLDDVRILRLTLAADLSTAAAAADLGAEHTIADIIEGDRRELATFTRRAISRLRALDEPALDEPALAGAAPAVPATTAPAERPWRRRALITLPAIPLAGALAMSAAAAMGVLPGQHSSHPTHVLSQQAPPVSSTFAQFASVASGDPSASQLVAAASALHEQIAAMIASAPHDPSGVREVAQLLQMEQALLLRKLPPGSSIVLAQSRRLAARLLSVTTVTTPSSQPMQTSSTQTTPRPTTTATATPKPSPTPSKSSPAPTVSPSSSPSSSESTGHLPTIGN